MTNGTNKTLSLEILISTMNRSSLSFLNKMFSNSNYLNYNILIVNQTTKENLLESEQENVRVINSFEKGLSKSRNLALKNAIGSICLIADDDLIFKPDFESIILNTYQNNNTADLIIFKASDLDGNDYRNYPKESHQLNKKSIKRVISWEITFNKASAQRLGISFNEYFGLGAEFPTAEEYLFVKSFADKKAKIYFENQVIVSHHEFNSGKDLGSDQIVYARAGLNYYIYRNLSYFWIFRYLKFLISNDFIKMNEINKKFRVALAGIKKCKTIIKTQWS